MRTSPSGRKTKLMQSLARLFNADGGSRSRHKRIQNKLTCSMAPKTNNYETNPFSPPQRRPDSPHFQAISLTAFFIRSIARRRSLREQAKFSLTKPGSPKAPPLMVEMPDRSKNAPGSGRFSFRASIHAR